MDEALIKVALVLGGGIYISPFLETILVHCFYRPLFFLGPVFYRQELELPRLTEAVLPHRIIKSEEGMFKFTSAEECLLTSRFHWFKLWRYKADIPAFKGVASWTPEGAVVTGRIPVSWVLIVLALLVIAGMWIASALHHADKKSLWFSIDLLLTIVCGVLASIGVQRSRMETMAGELQILSAQLPFGRSERLMYGD